MNRDIKFRAWHKAEKKMYWVETIDWTRDATAIFYLAVQLSTTIRESAAQEYELMQYTGLKDKNGKEIYEGDIVKYDDSQESHLFDSGQYIVGFQDGAFTLEKESTILDISSALSERHNPGYVPTHYEVIGNIYENKDLLNE